MNEKQRHRNDVLPGITGLAQAKGRNNISINWSYINFSRGLFDGFDSFKN